MPPPSSPALCAIAHWGGRSSIPETPVTESRGRDVPDTPLRIGRCLTSSLARHRADRLLPPELPLQLHLRALQPRALGLRQGLAGTVDIKGQHRQRRAIGAGLAARALLCRTFERCGDLLRAGLFE